MEKAEVAFLVAYFIRVFRRAVHLCIPFGVSPLGYRRLIRGIYERLIYDHRTQIVTVVRGPVRGAKKYGPFRESDFDFALGRYEPETVDALCQLCRPGMTVFDIGANAGYFTLQMAKLVGDRGQVHAFEPIPKNYQYLLETLRINGCRNVALHQTAISNRAGKARMNYNGLFDGFATLAEGGHNYYLGQSAEMVWVATMDLDRFCNDMGISEIGLVKMDIEGAEMLALEGMSEILAIQRPWLIIEFWGAKNIREGTRLLSSQGYNIKLLSVWNGFVRGVKTNIQNILASPL